MTACGSIWRTLKGQKLGKRGRGISERCLVGDPPQGNHHSSPHHDDAVGMYRHLELIQALGSEVRLQIIECLWREDADVSSLAAQLELDISKISRDLKRLWEVQLVDYSVDKNRHIFSLSDMAEVCICRKRACIRVVADDGLPLVHAIPRETRILPDLTANDQQQCPKHGESRRTGSEIEATPQKSRPHPAPH